MASHEKRRHIITTAVLISLFAGLIFILNYGLNLNPNQSPSTVVGKPATNFRVTMLSGKEWVGDKDTLSLADLRGKPIVLNFWASWCVSCREEAKEIEAFWQANRDSIQVVGIAIQDDPNAASQFAKIFGKTYAIGIDESGKAAIDYGVTGVPETFIIDASGVIVHKEAGPVSSATLEQFVTKI